MKIPFFQIDAFANQIFEGNPAAVCPLEKWLPDQVLQSIAAENNLSETAFYVENEKGLRIRWFTPKNEVKLCGHATLASAYVYLMHNNVEMVEFNSLSGKLSITKTDSQMLSMDFPARKAVECQIPENLPEALGTTPVKCLTSNNDMIAVLPSEAEVKSIRPDFRTIKELPIRALAVTSQSRDYDFVSRFFAPKEGVNEDPVTGSAHCMLAPYWSQIIGKNDLIAKQLSARGGIVHCGVNTTRVSLSGNAILFSQGEINV